MAAELQNGRLAPEPGKAKLLATHGRVAADWSTTATLLRAQGEGSLKSRTPPAGVKPVVRFRNPDNGDVTWDDLVKGPISISNDELDDLVIMRGDGVPIYNFGVVVDDLDMNMTHVIRGDDHVNNTPRQINIFNALGAPLPRFGHIPMILGADGERLSKRHSAVSVMQYPEEGYLPEALINYLARLGMGPCRCGNVRERAIRRMVFAQSGQPFGREVRSGKTEMAERAIYKTGGWLRSFNRSRLT